MNEVPIFIKQFNYIEFFICTCRMVFLNGLKSQTLPFNSKN